MKKGMFILCSLTLIIIAMIATIHSSYFTVNEVQINGVNQLCIEEIRGVLGKLEGQNIFLIPGREIVNTLLSYKRVKGAKLERKLPNALLIQIKERSGLALFKDETDHWVELSGDGMVLKVYGDEVLPKLPVVDGIKVEVNDESSVEIHEDLSRLFRILTLLFEMQPRMAKVSYDPYDVQITFDTKTILYLGQAIDLQKRIAIFKSLWYQEEFNLQLVEYIDLRYEGNPVIRLFDKSKNTK